MIIGSTVIFNEQFPFTNWFEFNSHDYVINALLSWWQNQVEYESKLQVTFVHRSILPKIYG